MSPACTTGCASEVGGRAGRERGPGQRAQLAAAAVPGRRRASGSTSQQADVREHRLELDMRTGTLTRRSDAGRTPDGRRTSVVQRRFVSMKDEHLAGLETEFTAENWSGTLEVCSGLDGRVVNAGVKRYRDLNGRHLTVLGQAEVDEETIDLQVETIQSHVRIALAARTRVLRDGRDRSRPTARLVEEPGFVAHELTFELEQGQPATVEKIVALYTSRDRAISESRHDARLTVAAAPATSRSC